MTTKVISVISAPSMLADELTFKLNEGWQLYGSPVLIPATDLARDRLLQLLTKTEYSDISTVVPLNG